MSDQGWRTIDESFPRHHRHWILWDKEADCPVVCDKRANNGTFWAGDWDYEVKAELYLPFTPPTTGDNPHV